MADEKPKIPTDNSNTLGNNPGIGDLIKGSNSLPIYQAPPPPPPPPPPAKTTE